MKITKPMLLACFTFMATASNTSIVASNFPAKVNEYLLHQMSDAKPVRAFQGKAPWGMQNVETSRRKAAFKSPDLITDPKPSITFDNLPAYDFLETPDGEIWFYKADFEVERVEVSEWYTEEYIKAYTFTIYDSNFNEVGSITDKITLAPGETKVASVSLDPYISYNFFNSDSKPEVMVYIAMNTGFELGYTVNYYNKIYSVGGDRDNDGNDICLGSMTGRCVDVFNSGDKENENLFFTFVETVYPNIDDFNSDQYIDYINSIKTVVSVYKSAVNNNLPQLAFEKEIFQSRFPGDTTDGIYLITRNENGVPYFVFSYYEKPYFIDPTGFTTDESATPDNNLMIEVLTYQNNQLNDISMTKIPVEIETSSTQINYSFYSIGSVAWKDDIDMSVKGSSSAPAFLVANDLTTAANLDDIISNYYIYDNNGNKVVTLAEGSESIYLLNSIKGQEPQALFVSFDSNEDYVFNFVNLYSGQKIISIPRVFDNEDFTSICERIASGDSYKYLFELRYDEQDEEGNDIKRIAWIDPANPDKIDQIDYLNMGKDVMASQVNMFPEALSPYLYDDDDAMEYAVLVKRLHGNTTRNEYMVIDDSGDWYATFSEDDGRGSPWSFTIIPGEENKLMMVYNDNYEINIDIYSLPFYKEGQDPGSVEQISPDNANISFIGNILRAEGGHITVYSISGNKITEGYNSLDLNGNPGGAYVAVIKSENGKSSAVKIIVR